MFEWDHLTRRFDAMYFAVYVAVYVESHVKQGELMATVSNPNRHQSASHSRDEISKTDRETRARSGIQGAFAGYENSAKGGNHLKERKPPRESGKTPKN